LLRFILHENNWKKLNKNNEEQIRRSITTIIIPPIVIPQQIGGKIQIDYGSWMNPGGKCRTMDQYSWLVENKNVIVNSFSQLHYNISVH